MQSFWVPCQYAAINSNVLRYNAEAAEAFLKLEAAMSKRTSWNYKGICIPLAFD